jgi:L-fuculose-phosphate aldolase
VEFDTPQWKVAAARRILFRAGLDHDDMAGQVTLRDEADPAAYWTSPMETFDVTAPGDVSRVGGAAIARSRQAPTADGRFAVVSEAGAKVSTASNWIAGIYEARRDVGCVIHTHAPYLGAVATTGEVVGLYNNRTLIFWDDQAFYDDDGRATDDRQAIVAALGERSVLIMRNHGAAVVGESIEMATMRAVLLERAAQFHVLARSIGGAPFAGRPEFAVRRVPHVTNLPLLWESHVRRLRTTDPDLFDVAVPAARKGA